MNNLINLGKNYFARMGVILLVLFLVGCSSSQQSHQVTLLHTNDHHGHFWQNKYGEYGLAAQKTLVDEIRSDVAKKRGNVFLLSGGDINTGTPESDLLNAEPDFIGMSLIGYDAMVIGNHEFDKPIDILRQQEKWANFPFLSANIYDTTTNKRMFTPYIILNKSSVKVAFIGVTTPDTLKLGSKKILKNVYFSDPVDEISKIATQIKKDKAADMIVVISHLGYYQDGKSGTSAPGDVELARSLDANVIDVILSAHSHSIVCMQAQNIVNHNYKAGEVCQPDYQNGIWIMQANEWGKFVGRADFKIVRGNVQLVDYKLLPVNLKYVVEQADGTKKRITYTSEIQPDSQVLQRLKTYKEQGDTKLNEVVGKTKVLLQGDRGIVRYQ